MGGRVHKYVRQSVCVCVSVGDSAAGGVCVSMLLWEYVSVGVDVCVCVNERVFSYLTTCLL